MPIADPREILTRSLAQIDGALAPLQPVFETLDMLIALLMEIEPPPPS